MVRRRLALAIATAAEANRQWVQRQGEIMVVNRQKAHPVPPLFRSNIQTMLKAAGPWCSSFDLGVCLVTNEEIQKVNKQSRHRNKPTDVISVPVLTTKPGRVPKVSHPEMQNLGDIYLGIPYILNQCKEFEFEVDQRLYQLVAHGIAHLMGYVHNNEEQEQQMQNKEKEMLHAIDLLHTDEMP